MSIFKIVLISLVCFAVNGFTKEIPRIKIIPSSAICKKRNKYLLTKWQNVRYMSLDSLDPIERKFPPGTEVCIDPKNFESDVMYSTGKDLKVVKKSRHGFFSNIKILKVPVNSNMKSVTPYNLDFWNSMNLYISKKDVYKKTKKSKKSLKLLIKKMKKISRDALINDCSIKDCLQ